MPRKSLTIAATLALTATALTTAPWVYATATARSEIARLVAEHAGMRVGAVEIDPFGQRVTLHDVAVSEGSVRVYARTLTLPLHVPSLSLVASAAAQTAMDRPLRLAQWPGTRTTPEDAPKSGIELKIPGFGGPTAAPAAPAQAAPAPSAEAPLPAPAPAAQSGSASATDVTIVNGDTTFVIKKIDLTGTTLSNADLATLLDPKAPDTIAARVAKLNAASIAITEATAAHKGGNGDGLASITKVMMTNVAGGKIGTASAAGIGFSDTSPKGGATAKTGTIQATGLDIGHLLHIIQSKRTDDAEPLKTLSESLVINEVAMTATDGTSLSIASITQKNLRARPLRTGLDDVNAAAAKTAPGDDTTRPDRMKVILDDVVSSYEVGAFGIEKFTVANTGKTNPFSASIAKIDLREFRKRALVGFAIRDFLVDAPAAKISFASFDLANIGIPPIGKTADPATALSTDSIPSAGKADLNQVVVDTTIPDDDGSVTKMKFKLAHMGTFSDQTVGHMPSQGAIGLDNLTFDLPKTESPIVKELYGMGYRDMDLSSVLNSTYDQKAEALSVQKFLVSGVGMGTMTLGVDLINVGKGIMSANPSVAKASALSMLLKHVDLKVVNAGLVDKALDWKAGIDGKTPAAERDGVIDLVSVQIPESLGNNPAIKAIGTALAKFIKEPKTLHIGLTAKDGLGAADLGLIGAPDELFAKVDVVAEANQ